MNYWFGSFQLRRSQVRILGLLVISEKCESKISINLKEKNLIAKQGEIRDHLNVFALSLSPEIVEKSR